MLPAPGADKVYLFLAPGGRTGELPCHWLDSISHRLGLLLSGACSSSTCPAAPVCLQISGTAVLKPQARTQSLAKESRN